MPAARSALSAFQVLRLLKRGRLGLPGLALMVAPVVWRKVQERRAAQTRR
ncbi:hypothetical protein EV189_3293 [Motilibacter rhizosphaerae]|uniref:Uncharacterized protein n=1 Tax=Motilibacter rhizosphaerae TaxID=598652 RepID=A0A4Q7NHH2_9ACTN|nr:hypothetical protein [Motilibacter rhizosphaerae]RZS82896.1 hypothetical protein EV189_3293 [Motilibacter rhizosphaerae]